MNFTTPIVVLLAALAVLAAGCDLGREGDKAGGSRAPTVLRLAVATPDDESDAAAARFFAARVAELSDGSLRVRVVFNAAGKEIADTDAEVVRMVHDGSFDLGWIASRGWDTLGVKTFQALQAPFLVTDYALIDRIATGPLAARMLGGLRAREMVGLALVPDRLRHPIGVDHPLASASDFAGARVRVRPSRAAEALIRALDATPVRISGADIDSAMAQHEVDGTEHSLGGFWPGGHYLTANITFFANAITLFAARNAYDRLDAGERAALRTAADQTVRHAAAHPPNENEDIHHYCDGGRVVLATSDDLAALARAAQPVYAKLERDPETHALIATIRELKEATRPTSTTVPPHACAEDAAHAHGRRVSTSTLNGTYRWRLTKAGAIAVGDENDPELDEADGDVFTMTLRGGKWLLQGGATGTYQIIGNRLIFDWPQVASTLTLQFARRDNGDLDVKPVLPMDRGDRWVWASAPWRRIGPPIRDIP